MSCRYLYRFDRITRGWCDHHGEFVMKANGGKYCLDDPASSTHNGTQLIVWTCKNGTNQHWFTSLG
jgi:hypothetical protein